MGNHYDAVIAGGGLSGLSLAAHLAGRGWGDRSVLVVDDGRAHPAAQRWGFWSAGPELLDAAVTREFDRVRIHAGGQDRLLALGRYRYRVVARADLVPVVGGRLSRCPGFQIRRGTVERIWPMSGRAAVTVDGETVTGDWVFDSVTRPGPGAPADARLAFTGWDVRTDRPVFDPAVPVLFDFRTPQGGRARFVYVLPTGPREALVELTEFVPRSARPPAAAARQAAIVRYLSDVVGLDGYEVRRTESAVLPLRVGPIRRRRGRVLAIGATGGLVKASTGYAFHRIQRDSAAIATALVHYGHPFARPPAPARYRLLDATLLDVLDRDPAQLQRAFAQLFRGNPVERVLSFPDETTTVRDDMRLIASLAPGPYLRSLARRAFPHRRPGAEEAPR